MSKELFETISYLKETGELSPECRHLIDDAVLINGYKMMVQTRNVDKQMTILQRQGMISFAMSSLGEEACAVAAAAALEPEDWIYPQYREAGVTFWRGFSIQQYVHHMFCDAEDLIHGRQMPNHFGSRELNIVHVSSPIATKIPHAAGAAYSMKLQKEKTVTVCFFGEGATSEGDFHVGLNFAAVRKTPTIFFCRNNGYAISTPCKEQFSSDGVAPKGVGYGIETFRVDGNDFFAVHHGVARARQACLAGQGPILIEAMTYRLGAHSTSDDPTLYRSPEEALQWEAKDPILRLRLYLEAKGLWNATLEDEWNKEISQQIEKAILIAKGTPKPQLHSMIEDVYFDVPKRLTEEYEGVIN